MHSITTGYLLLGFTELARCAHCNNEIEFHVRQDYVKQAVFGFPIVTSYYGIKKICPICEHGEWLIGRSLFVGDKVKQRIADLLEGGRDKTKHYVLQLKKDSQDIVLKQLNKLKAFSLVRYIGS